MTYTDPLIKELKYHILKLNETLNEGIEITDTCQNVIPFFDTIERIFLKGCIVHGWNALDEIAELMALGQLMEKSLTYLRSVESVRNCLKVKTPIGKLRLLIKTCLVNKCLHVPVEIMVRLHNNVALNSYNSEASVLGDEILGEIFLSVLLQCSTMHFKLDLKNTRFLDITLDLPHYVVVEFVPCNTLGVAITFIDDKALVIHVDEKSVAAEDDQIEVGDVLDELNGQVIHSELKGKLSSIMSKGKNKPVVAQLIKSRNPVNNHIYKPIELLLKKANINVKEKVHSYSTAVTRKGKVSSRCTRSRNVVNYVKSVTVGEAGHVRMIEFAISEAVKNSKRHNWIKVEIECHELGLKVLKEATRELITCNSFMEISSCGQTKTYPDYFGYIAGDNLCNLASKFTCHVFQTDHDNEIQNILQSIGEGFQRTHFAV